MPEPDHDDSDVLPVAHPEPKPSAKVGWISHSGVEIRDMVYRAQSSIKALRDEIARSNYQSKPQFDIRGYNAFVLRWQAFWDGLKAESWPYIENNSDATYDKAREFYDSNQRWRSLAHDVGLVANAADPVKPPTEKQSGQTFMFGLGTGTLLTIGIGLGLAYFFIRRD